MLVGSLVSLTCRKVDALRGDVDTLMAQRVQDQQGTAPGVPTVSTPAAEAEPHRLLCKPASPSTALTCGIQ